MDFDAMIGDDSWLQDSPPRLAEPVSKPLNITRSKALNIDDLLKDHYKDKSKNLNHRKKRLRTYVSDSEDLDDEEFDEKTHKEVKFEQLVESCEKQVHAGGATVEVLKWGEQMFDGQKEKRTLVCLSPENTMVQALLVAKASIPIESRGSDRDEQTADSLVLELLASGWFLSFGVKPDNELMSWILYTMMFTTDTDVERAACEFLCHQFESETVDYSCVPCYRSIVETLEAYGYVGPSTSKMEGNDDTFDTKGPPHNLGSFLRLLAALVKRRHLHHVYSREDVEELAVLISSLLLDRNLLGYSLLVQECLAAILDSFTEEEWADSCNTIALHMAKYDRHMVNCLKLTRSLHSRDVRMRSLQSSVALHFFAKLTNEEAIHGVWELLSVFRKMDVKRTVVDFMSLYHQMSLADVWLWSNPAFESDTGALESWLHFLKSCSFQISSTDWRPYATKVRNQASYLLQVYQCYYQVDEYGPS